MSDHSPNHDLSSEAGLGQALRALPLAAPDKDTWQDLAATLQTRISPPGSVQSRLPHRWRYLLPAALAAGLVLFFIAPNRTSDPSASINRTAETTEHAQAQPANDATHELAALHARSQSLEQWLRETRDAASSLNGQDLLASTEIEDLIGLVDVQLQAPTTEDARALWRQRVRLLQDLAALRYSQYSLASNRVANDGTSATHAIWIN